MVAKVEKRDPRRDPVVGDMLVRGLNAGHCQTRRVTKVDGTRISYFAYGTGRGMRTGDFTCEVGVWRDWAQRAQIEERGETAA